MKIALFAYFEEYHRSHKNFKSLYGFRGRCLKIRDICMDFEVIFQKRVRVFHRGFKHEKTDESTRPQAACFYCFRVLIETPMKHEAQVFKITSPTKKN